MKNGSGIGVKLFQVLVAPFDSPILHCIQIHVVVDKLTQAFHVASKVVQLLRLFQQINDTASDNSFVQLTLVALMAEDKL